MIISYSISCKVTQVIHKFFFSRTQFSLDDYFLYLIFWPFYFFICVSFISSSFFTRGVLFRQSARHLTLKEGGVSNSLF